MVKKRDGSSYEPDSLTSLQRNPERHLRNNLGKQYSILQDREFALSREAIIASRKKLKKEGKGNKPRVSESQELSSQRCGAIHCALRDVQYESFIFFLEKRPTELCSDDSPFYLTTNLKFAINGVWYRRQPMGINKLAAIMKVMSAKAGLQGHKQNHTARKMSVQTLRPS